MLVDKVQVIEDRIIRYDYEDHDYRNFPTASKPYEAHIPFLHKPSHITRSVHYDIELIPNHERERFRSVSEMEQPSIDNVLRRRYIAHWGLPGKKQ